MQVAIHRNPARAGSADRLAIGKGSGGYGRPLVCGFSSPESPRLHAGMANRRRRASSGIRLVIVIPLRTGIIGELLQVRW